MKKILENILEERAQGAPFPWVKPICKEIQSD